MPGPNRKTSSWLLALLAVSGVVLAGCADFENKAAGQTFVSTPALTPKAGGEPILPGEENSPKAQQRDKAASPSKIPPPQGCKDFDPAVVETCLDTVSSVAVLPGSETKPTALVGERKSGRLLKVSPNTDPVEVGKLAVDAGGDGGLTAVALSPTYGEDQLFFAYITTATDNRVVRIRAGQEPKPILTGIPKGASGNRGALLADSEGALLVATGDAGNPSVAANASSLAGKVLRIDVAGTPAAGNPQAGSPMLASGLHNPGGLCKAGDGKRLWVTDRAGGQDSLFRIQPGTSLSAPVWTWTDKPGLAGCLDNGNSIMVATSTVGTLQSLPITPAGSAGGTPSVMFDGKDGSGYGKLAGLDAINAEFAMTTTVNKDGGAPVSSDDRVVVIPRQPSGGGSSSKD